MLAYNTLTPVEAASAGYVGNTRVEVSEASYSALARTRGDLDSLSTSELVALADVFASIPLAK